MYADVHGNVKFILNTPVKNRYVIDFKLKKILQICYTH